MDFLVALGRAFESTHVACPVPNCCERPVATCEFCPSHQCVINDAIAWLNVVVPRDFAR